MTLNNSKMEDIRNSKIGELVADDYRKAGVFKKFGLDFCCGGGKSIAEACEKKGINEEELIDAIKLLDDKEDASEQNFNEWKLDLLADYIINVHHSYVRQNLPLILQFSYKAARVHGHAHDELVKINEKFQLVADELTMHMQKEEMVLFPYIKELAKSSVNEPASPPPFGTVANPIRMMEAEHENAGNLLKEISELSNDYTPPEYACNTWRVLFAHLEDFENDLHRHIHLENNILFPKAIQLETALFQS